MPPNASPSAHQIVQQRIILLLELATSLEQAQRALLKTNLEEFRSHTTRQQELCRLLREDSGEAAQERTEPRVDGSKSSEPQPESAASERWTTLGAQLRDVEQRVAELNCCYGALLRRARRTVDIFCRVLTNSGLTYAPPGQSRAGMWMVKGET